MMKEFHVDYCIIESNLSSEYIFEKILKQRFKTTKVFHKKTCQIDIPRFHDL